MDEIKKIPPPAKFSEEGFAKTLGAVASSVAECRGLLNVIRVAKGAGSSMKHNQLYQLSLRRFRDSARDIAARVETLSDLFGSEVRDSIMESLGCSWVESEKRVNFGKA